MLAGEEVGDPDELPANPIKQAKSIAKSMSMRSASTKSIELQEQESGADTKAGPVSYLMALRVYGVWFFCLNPKP